MKGYDLLHDLAMLAEPSGEENRTKSYIDFFMSTQPHITGGALGKSLVYVYEPLEPKGELPLRTVAIRTDIDALRIDGNTYAHRCGHHGHTAILMELSKHLPQVDRYKVILVFQAAEETGEGALDLINQGLFEKHHIDVMVGFHNIPGYPNQQMLIRPGVFNNSTIGLKIQFKGKPSHAGYPEDGNSPALAMSDFIKRFSQMATEDILHTITHVRLGEPQFGTAYGEGVVLATIRCEVDQRLWSHLEDLKKLLTAMSDEYYLAISMSTSDYFRGIENDPDVVQNLVDYGRDEGFGFVIVEDAFRWGEDFGFYCEKVPCCFFGVGIGEEAGQLHSENYAFPDQLVPYMANLLLNWLIKR